MPVRAGSIVVFTSLTPHYTGRNTHRRRPQGLHRAVRARRRRRLPAAARRITRAGRAARRRTPPVRGRARRPPRRRLTWSRRSASMRRALAAREVSAVELTRRLDHATRCGATHDRRGGRASTRNARSPTRPAATRGSPTEPTGRWKACRSPSRTGSTSRAGRSPGRPCNITTAAPTRDATAVARLRAAGAVVAGITTALAESPAHGATRNPRDPTARAGGSSSGAAAVVAAGASPLALGSDSGGSIRLPAAWCGVYGLEAHVRTRAAHRPLPPTRRALGRAHRHRPAGEFRRRSRAHVATHRRSRRHSTAASRPSRSKIPQPSTSAACASDSSRA